jgi:predicted ABC-type ATPase
MSNWTPPMLTDQQINERFEAQTEAENQSMRDWINTTNDENFNTTEDDLRQNPQWILASRVLYNQNNGKKFSGTDQEAADYGLDQMGAFNYSFFNMDAPWAEEDTVGMVGYLSRIQEFDDRGKLAFLLLMNTYDEKDVTWEGVKRGFSNVFQDPTTYGGITTLASLGAKFSGRSAVKSGVKAWLEHAAHGTFSRTGMAIGAFEGGSYTAADQVYRERIDAELGDREAFSDLSGWLLESAPTIVLGTTIGAAIPAAGMAVNRLRPRPDIPVPDRPDLIVEEVNKNGKLQRNVRVDEAAFDVDAENFNFPDLAPTLADNHRLIAQDSQARNKKGFGEQSEFFNPTFGHEGRPVYKAIRTQSHNRIINKAIEKSGDSIPAEGEKKVAVFLGGGSGAGKTTGFKSGIESGAIPDRQYVNINPDDIKEQLSDYKTIKREGDYRAAMQTHEESSDVGDLLLERAVNDGRNVLIDKTMANPEKNLALMELLRSKGYEIQFMGVSVDAGTAAMRNLGRFYNSGRIPFLQAIGRTHKGFNANTRAYLEAADQGVIMDNSGGSLVIAARKGEDGSVEVWDPMVYNMILERGNLNEEAKTIRELRGSSVTNDNPGDYGESPQGSGSGGAQTEGAASGLSPERLREQRAADLGFSDETFFHGSTRDFTEFSDKFGNPDNHYGLGHYFTTSLEDASDNYSGSGPDLNIRLETVAESAFPDLEGKDGIDAARKLLGVENDGVVYPVKLRTDKVVRVGDDDAYTLDGERETFWELDPSDPDEEIFDPSGEFMDVLEATIEAADQWGVPDTNELQGKLLEAAMDQEGMGASEFEKILRDHMANLGADASPGTVVSQVYHDLGYDAIDMDAGVFKNMDGVEGQRHFIIFDPTRIRSIHAEFDKNKIDSANILSSVDNGNRKRRYS